MEDALPPNCERNCTPKPALARVVGLGSHEGLTQIPELFGYQALGNALHHDVRLHQGVQETVPVTASVPCLLQDRTMLGPTELGQVSRKGGDLVLPLHHTRERLSHINRREIPKFINWS